MTKKEQKRADKVAALFTKEEREEISNVLQDVWREIGADCLQAVGEGESGVMTQDEVIEVVLDAGRAEETAKRSRREGVVDIIKRFMGLPIEDHNAFCKAHVFKYARYGW